MSLFLTTDRDSSSPTSPSSLPKDLSSGSDEGRSPSPSPESSSEVSAGSSSLLLEETSRRAIVQLYHEYKYREYVSAAASRNNGHVLNSLNNYLSHYHGQSSSFEVDNGRVSRTAGGSLPPVAFTGPQSRSTPINYTNLKNSYSRHNKLHLPFFAFTFRSPFHFRFWLSLFSKPLIPSLKGFLSFSLFSRSSNSN